MEETERHPIWIADSITEEPIKRIAEVTMAGHRCPADLNPLAAFVLGSDAFFAAWDNDLKCSSVMRATDMRWPYRRPINWDMERILPLTNQYTAPQNDVAGSTQTRRTDLALELDPGLEGWDVITEDDKQQPVDALDSVDWESVEKHEWEQSGDDKSSLYD